MSPLRSTFHVSLLAALLLLISVPGALAQSGGQYDLTWNTVDGGGASLITGDGYELAGSIGQPDAGPALANVDYVLVGGFWSGALAECRVYLPLVLRSLP